MKVRVDATKCSGIGLCEAVAPTVFTVGDDGRSRVINPEPSPDEQATVEEAVSSCPTGALCIED